MKKINFTFDIEKIFSNSSYLNTNFSQQIFCDLDYDKMITQNDLLKKLDIKDSLGFCILVSIYNAFQNVFKFFNDFVDFTNYMLRNNLDYSNLKKVVTTINKYKNQTLLYNFENLQKSYKITCNNIKHNKPVVITYKLHDSFLPTKLVRHAITIVGLNDTHIFYKENSETNYLFESLAYYIMNYYKLNMPKKSNLDYNKICKLIKETNEQNCWKIVKELLSYNIGHDNISSIKKVFLTNNQYFYDSNGLCTYSKNSLNTIDTCGNTNNIQFSLIQLKDFLDTLNK